MRNSLCLFGFVRLAGAVLFLAAAGGCETLPGPPINILTTQQEVQLGRELAEEIEEKEPLHDNAQLQNYVRTVGDRLARVAPRQDVEYQFTVIDEPDTVNAFALPGGHMYLYTGLMKLVENEAELAGVMAHEIGHVTARHHGERLTRMYGYNLLVRVLLGEDPGAATNIASHLVEMTYSRENEREADAIAVELLWRADYNPEAMLTFMEKMREKEQRRGADPSLPFLSSHPPHPGTYLAHPSARPALSRRRTRSTFHVCGRVRRASLEPATINRGGTPIEVELVKRTRIWNNG